jgi:hypothetical protein
MVYKPDTTEENKQFNERAKKLVRDNLVVREHNRRTLYYSQPNRYTMILYFDEDDNNRIRRVN